MSEKIQGQHLERKAILYVRQSSAHQVLNNQESRRLQYAMQQRLHSLGWKEVDVIDEDLGRSAAGTVARTGFERMVAEVCLGKVGVVAAREVSRFARNSRDWQRLVEVCRVVDTLLLDHETVYAPRQGNDRLLLGLKGSLNEYELDLLRLRSVEARHAMALRGELIVAAPVGFLKTDDQRIEKDPDRRIQEAVLLVFRKFVELGSVRQVLMWLLEHELQLPARDQAGQLLWKRPRYAMVHRILTNPTYGGAYAYGKTESVLRYENGNPRRTARRKPREQWLALIPNSHEGYIAWEQFERIQAMISENNCTGDGAGAARRGAALLAGLLRCGRCGRKLVVHYTGSGRDVLRYACNRGHLDKGEPKCIAFGGTLVDEALSGQVLRVVEPGAVQASVLASEQEADQQDEVLEALRRDLEAARYQSDRAGKQFDRTDPENRLVADELERRWNQTLEHVHDLEARIDGHVGMGLDAAPATVEEFSTLAADLGAVWNDPSTDVRLKKRVVRALIQEVVADVDAEAGEVVLVVHWKGGAHTELRTPRRRRGQCTQTSKDIVAAVRILARTCTDDLIAGVLNRNGQRTGRGNRWTRERVTSLRSYNKIPRYRAEERELSGWMNLTEAAKLLGLSTRTLRLAVERAEIDGEHPLADGPWVFHREQLETNGARAVVERARSRNGDPAVPLSNQGSLEFPTT
ncbi:MAG: recombinase family protein [Gammaproteobacteria bacterium]|nr:MAG: recombinase family protein [Gammaproteobacteria bacterium]